VLTVTSYICAIIIVLSSYRTHGALLLLKVAAMRKLKRCVEKKIGMGPLMLHLSLEGIVLPLCNTFPLLLFIIYTWYFQNICESLQFLCVLKSRFIIEKCAGVLVIENKKMKVMIEELKRSGYDPDPVAAWQMRRNKDEVLVST
jgi:hypothetical protein